MVEEAVLDDIYKSPLHPYTIGLLKSIPSLKTEAGSRLPSIPGAPPNLFTPPTGCPFAPRCEHKIDRCQTEVPALAAVPGSSGERPHRVACWVDMRGRGVEQ